jgi:hypothetical protein
MKKPLKDDEGMKALKHTKTHKLKLTISPTGPLSVATATVP